MTARAAILLALACSACFGRTVRIGVFGLFRPVELTLRSAEGWALLIDADGQRTTVEGGGPFRCALRQGAVACAANGDTLRARRVTAEVRGGGEFVLGVPGKIERRFAGRLDITAGAGALVAVIVMPVEAAVASSVAAESPPGAGIEALRAQAVLARSFYLASRARHADFDFCDTTHCQFLRDVPKPDSPAARAARDTSGTVLAWGGRPLAALYTASCGGRTRALKDPPPGEYPYFAVECPYCRRGKPVRCSYCVRETGAWANRRGAGAGHGLGLCQRGAAAMAAEGAGFRAILERYFPNTSLIEWRD
jgi:hypothetical protein